MSQKPHSYDKGQPPQNAQPGPYYGQQGQGQPPPPAAYGQPHYGQPVQAGYGQQATVVIQQPVTIMMGDVPAHMTCPNCHNQIVTSTTHETGTMTWVACLVLCFVGCDLGCCLIPFCIDSCKDTVHHCPSCRTTLGRKNKM